MSFSLLDAIIVVVLFGGLIRGSMIGAVRQVVSLVGLVVAFLFSVQFMDAMGQAIVSSLGVASEVGPFIGFVVLFIGVYVLFLAVSRLVEQVIESLSLTVIDRAAGGLVGTFKAGLLLSVLFLVLASIEIPGDTARKDSALYPPVVRLLPWTLEATEGWFPAAREAADELGRQVRPKLDSSGKRREAPAEGGVSVVKDVGT